MVPHMPVVMMFAYSSNGLSHCKEEDTPREHLEKNHLRVFAIGSKDSAARRPLLLNDLRNPLRAL